ncbi:MAG: pyroglutamyl-peptidase I [Actinobacteria bacterium]|nr:pyroglutamyl-peptidase I [Actinomycetota bacterium]
MLRVLLTGFEPFNNGKLNPSEQIVRHINKDDVPGAEIFTKVLPVGYAESAEELLALVEEHKPDVVISFGQAEGRTAISVERFAVNMDDAGIADNFGVKRTDQKIHENSPTAFETTLPLKELVAAIKAEGIPAAVSLSAGTFVCNHIFYEMQKALEGKNIISGFVHVPLMTEQQEDFPGLFTMPIDQMVIAAKTMVKQLAKTI